MCTHTQYITSARYAVAGAEPDTKQRRQDPALPKPVSEHVAACRAASRTTLPAISQGLFCLILGLFCLIVGLSC